MIQQILWLTQVEFDTLCVKSKHVDTTWHKQAMVNAQELDIRPCLGTALYDEITLQVATNTLTVANNALREMFAQALAYYTAKRAMYLGWGARVMPIGTVKNVDSTAENQTNYELSALRANLDSWANEYKSIAVKWLADNSDDYPLLPKEKCGCGRGNKCQNPGTYSPFYYLRNKPNPFKCPWFGCSNSHPHTHY